jgi:integrase/recombinase XerD
VAERAWLLKWFVQWSRGQGMTRALEVSPAAMERYQRAQAEARPDGTFQSLDQQLRRLRAVRDLFGWLVRQHVVPWNPAGELQLPRPGRRLPRTGLSYEKMERVLAQPNVARPGGLRDRAMMEVLYSTGLRRLELLRLKVHDVEPDRGTVLVREGKGRKDRVVPIGPRALAWVRRWLVEVRPEFAVPSDEGILFLTRQGRPIGAAGFTALMGRYVRRALACPGACHVFRHTVATLMLENGADVRYVQELLGHAYLETTQIYTHVSVLELREVHAATHPAEVGVLKRPGARE